MEGLLLVGIATLAGFLGGKLSNKFGFPAVVGYIVIGLFLGPSILGILKTDFVESVGFIADITLGFVAFIIGSELRLSQLRQTGKSIMSIILAQSFGAFAVVALPLYLLTKNLPLALIFGAMAPASAPAGTLVVLQEYRAKGPLTNTILAVVGLDDGLAIIIYAFAAAIAKASLVGTGGLPVSVAFVRPLVQTGGAILIGVLTGICMALALRKVRTTEETLIIVFGSVLICTGVCNLFRFSLILANLLLGATVANTFLRISRRGYRAIQLITPPLYVIFFVLAGAHLQIGLLIRMGLVGFVYLLARTAGKIGGAFMGAAISRAEPQVRNWVGIGILSQAGVAVGLAIMVGREFSGLGAEGEYLALLAINVIAATTIVFEIIGPLAIKVAISRAGEIRKRKGDEESSPLQG
jgi:Kef-type K+ transport system membrane component KefB